MDRFIARENVKHYRRELENGVHEPTRTTMLKLLVEEENHLGLTREQLFALKSANGWYGPKHFNHS